MKNLINHRKKTLIDFENKIKIKKNPITKGIKEIDNKKTNIKDDIDSFRTRKKLKTFVNDVINMNRYIRIFVNKDKKKDNIPSYILLPNTKKENVFQIINIIFILYSVTVIPFQIAFYSDFDDNLTFEIIGYVIDFFFLIDFIKSFFSAYYDNDGNLITDIKKISLNYLFGWFLLDLLSIIPFRLIFESDNYFNRLSKFPKIIKFIKITKIFRFLKLFKNKKLVSNYVNIHKSFERIVGLLLISFIIFHTLSCIWYLIGNFFDFEIESWVEEYEITNLKVLEKYLICFYWIVQTVFTVGYGDYAAQNYLERLFLILIMFIGVFIYSFIIGNWNTIFNILNSENKSYTKNIETLNTIVKDNKINRKDKILNKIKYFLKYYWFGEQKINEFIEDLPEVIKKEITLIINKEKVENIEYFLDKSDDFLIEICSKLKLVKYKKNEIIYKKDDLADEIFFIKKGIINIYHKKSNQLIFKFSDGSYFGELDVFFYNSNRNFEAIPLFDSEWLVLKYEFLDCAFFKKYLDCGEQMIINAKKKHEKLKRILLLKNINLEENNTESNISDNIILKVPNKNLLDIKKNKFKRMSFNANSDAKNLENINNAKSQYLQNQNQDGKKNPTSLEFDLNKKNFHLNLTNSFKKITNNYWRLAEKYSYLFLNDYKKNDKKNFYNYNYFKINNYINFEEEINYKTKQNILTMQKSVKSLKLNLFNLKK